MSEKLLTVDDVVIDREAAPADAYFDTSGDGVPDSDFVVGRGAILVDTANPGLGTACGLITDVNAAGNQVRVDFQNFITAAAARSCWFRPSDTPSSPTSTAADAAAQRHRARERRRGSAGRVLHRPGRGRHAQGGRQRVPGLGRARTTPSKYTDHSKLREIRFNIVVRSRNTDPTYSEGFVQATENRGAVGVNDGFRRRVFTSTVRPRNIGYRGVQASG